MPCDTRLKPRQSISERKVEVRKAAEKLSAALAAGRVKVKLSKMGAIAFEGFTDADRDGVTDACAYRMVMKHGSALARMAIQKAEQLSGVTVNKQVVASGVHSHDGGETWHGRG